LEKGFIVYGIPNYFFYLLPLGLHDTYRYYEKIMQYQQKERFMELAEKYRDRRRYERESCSLSVDVDDFENAYSGKLYNIGLGGAGIKAPPGTRFKTGQELFLTIPYRHKEDYLIIKGKIVWQNREDIGIEFLKKPSC
jgi:Tfp pilus assembly protein PilZ